MFLIGYLYKQFYFPYKSILFIVHSTLWKKSNRISTLKSCYCHDIFLLVVMIDWNFSLYASCLVLDQCHDFQEGWINSLVEQFVWISVTFILGIIIRTALPRKYIITHWKHGSENLQLKEACYLIIRFYFNSVSIEKLITQKGRSFLKNKVFWGVLSD